MKTTPLLLRTMLSGALVLAGATLGTGCNSETTTRALATVNETTRPDAGLAALPTRPAARTEIDRAAPSDFETATFALG